MNFSGSFLYISLFSLTFFSFLQKFSILSVKISFKKLNFPFSTSFPFYTFIFRFFYIYIWKKASVPIFPLWWGCMKKKPRMLKKNYIEFFLFLKNHIFQQFFSYFFTEKRFTSFIFNYFTLFSIDFFNFN